MCCKLLLIKELDKPAGQWCPHCDIGNGCTIYDSRPAPCRSFTCLWLMNPEVPGELRPDKVRAFLSATTDGKNLAVHVDPGQPDAYKKGDLQKFLAKVTAAGIGVIVVCGNDGKVLTQP